MFLKYFQCKTQAIGIAVAALELDAQRLQSVLLLKTQIGLIKNKYVLLQFSNASAWFEVNLITVKHIEL